MTTSLTTLNEQPEVPPAATLADILGWANALPAKPIPMSSLDLMPTIIVLRDEKHMSWTEIRAWVRDSAALDRSETFWTQLYKKTKGIKKAARKPGTPKVVNSPASTSPITKTSLPAAAVPAPVEGAE